MGEQPWYHNGLRFHCTACGNCCTGAPGYVWVNKQEILDLAAAMGCADSREFERKYVRRIGVRRSLKELANHDCVLFDGETRKCRAYDARPRQCRTWPFWTTNTSSPEAWERTCRICPGSGKGKLYQLADIEAQRKVIHI